MAAAPSVSSSDEEPETVKPVEVEPEVTVEETDFTADVLQEVENRISEGEKVEDEAPQTEAPPADDTGKLF